MSTKRTFHLCLSAGEEVLFRDIEDYHRGFNCFAIALHKTGSTGLVEAFMATHTHQLVQSNIPKEFMRIFRISYCKYFNHKYQREGHFGESHHFSMEIVGYHHLLAAISYVLRNPLHHGVVSIPYAYPHCSVNSIFRKDMGKSYSEKILPEKSIYKYIGRKIEFPDKYKMTESGVFTRDSVLDIPQVENLFVSPRAFNYYMSRKSSEEWDLEQKKDGDLRENHLINIASIEAGVKTHELNKMLWFESGKGDYRKTSDIELCTELDEMARSRLGRHSVYQMTDKEKQEVALELYHTRHLSEAQIRRCLAMEYK